MSCVPSEHPPKAFLAVLSVMSKVPWPLFTSSHPQAHLLAASVPAAREVGNSDLKTAQYVLGRLVRELAPTGEYATTLVRASGRPEVYVAFEHEDDARKVAQAVRAKVSRRYTGWASQRACRLDAVTVRAMLSSHPPVKSRRAS
jgi:hypothetical protein